MDGNLIVALLGFAGALIGAAAIILARNPPPYSPATTIPLGSKPSPHKNWIAGGMALLVLGLLIAFVSTVSYLASPGSTAIPTVVAAVQPTSTQIAASPTTSIPLPTDNQPPPPTDTTVPLASIPPTPIPVPTNTQSPPPTNTQSPVLSECTFLTTLVTKGVVLIWLDEPQGSGNLAGVQIRIHTATQVPSGWVVQHDGKTDYGPTNLIVNEVASVWSPEYCRPLPKPTDYGLDCTFLNAHLANIKIIQFLSDSTGQIGVQARVLAPISIPKGWAIIHESKTEYGPIDLTTIGEVVSIYAPETCRPIQVP